MRIFSFLLFFFVFTLFTSCDFSKEQIDLTNQVDLNSILQTYNQGKLAEYQGELITGNISYYKTSDDFIIRPHDKEYAFMLQVDQLPKDFSNLKFTGSKLLYIHNQILIVDNSNVLIAVVRLSNAEVLTTLADAKAPFELKGFGLIKTDQIDFTSVDSKINLRSAQVNNIDEPQEVSCVCEPAGASSNCTAGGTGASSCSISDSSGSCSVACSGDWTACCD